MPLTDPKIDDRTFEQILAELRLRIPRYTKEWTNFNDSDPGITLLQLFAWLSETMLFRMNQVPRKNYVKFLRLLGEDLAPPRPASAHLTFSVTANAKPDPVPARARVSASVDDGGDALIFETGRALDLIPGKLDAVGLFDGAGFMNVTSANDAPGTKFKPFGPVPDPGNALYLGFVPPDPLPPGRQQFFPKTMTFRVFLPAEATAGKPQACKGTATPPVPPVTLAWEYRPRAGEPWQRLNVLEDESAAFTREGYVRVQGPAAIQPTLEPRLADEARFWIRVRLEPGKRYPAGRAPEIDFLRPNTVEAAHLATIHGEVLGFSEGHPGEQFETQRKPVSSLSLDVTLANGEVEAWSEVADFLASKAEDKHYRLNRTSGVVQFGDGERGRIPEAGSTITATQYRYGGGKRGNAAGVGAISAPLSSLAGVEKVTNERPAAGGTDEQTLEEILVTGPALLKQRGRAVTPDDFGELVRKTDGVAHATALPLFHPDHRDVKVPGAVTVVVVPDNEDKPPKPSTDLLTAICRMLDEVRLLTTEVFVKGPEYQQVRVEARVTASPYASFDTVSLDVLKAIDDLLDPRRGGFGKDLSITRFYSTILNVKDVAGVATLNVFVDGRRHGERDSIKTPADGLLFGGDHIITVEAGEE